MRGSAVLVAPQGFEPIEIKRDMTNLVEDAHMDAHTAEKIFEERFSPPSSTLLVRALLRHTECSPYNYRAIGTVQLRPIRYSIGRRVSLPVLSSTLPIENVCLIKE